MASPIIQLWDKEFWNKGARRKLYQDYMSDEANAQLQANLARDEKLAAQRAQEAKDERTWRSQHERDLRNLQHTLQLDEMANRFDLEGNMQAATDIRRHGLALDMLNTEYGLRGREKEGDRGFIRERDDFELTNRPDMVERREIMDALATQAEKLGIPAEEAQIAAQNARHAQIAEKLRADLEVAKAIANNPLLELRPNQNPLDPNSKLGQMLGGGGGGARVQPGTRIPKGTGTGTTAEETYRKRYGY